MTCDSIVFSVLYRGDIMQTRELVLESARRLDAPWDVPYDLELLRGLYILLVHKDPELKSRAIDTMEPRKAEAFFLDLGPQVVDRWLATGHLNNDWLIEQARMLYLVS